jgi:hypothetical protein
LLAVGRLPTAFPAMTLRMTKAGLTVLLLLTSVLDVQGAEAPPVGIRARIQAAELGSGWYVGFVNRTRTEPPCHLVLLLEPRTTPEQALRVRATVPVTRITRLQVTSHPGLSMQESKGMSPPPVPEDSWREVDIARLRPGGCG